MFWKKDKNPSTRNIALTNAFAIGFICFCYVYFFHSQLKHALGFGIFIGCVTYTFAYFTLQRVIYRKVRLIYKLISQTKATKKEEFYYDNLLPQKTLNEVHEEVIEWSEKNSREIQLLRQNEQFRQEFLLNVAHELRTPIFSIQGYVDSLLDGAIHDPNVNIKFLQNASNNVSRLAQLVDDLDQITELETDRLPLVYTEFVIQDVIKEVFSELTIIAISKNMEFRFKEGTSKNIEVYADRKRIKQVVTNLVENAMKYGKINGIINCGVYILDENSVLVEITDDGGGIAEEHLKRIFERFYRVDRSRSSKIAGTGLGLSIVKHIIEAHNQSVTVRSTPNVGTTFGFTLSKYQG